MNNKEEFKALTHELVKLGESRDEFDFLLKILDDLPGDKQRELVTIMKKELGELENLSRQ